MSDSARRPGPSTRHNPSPPFDYLSPTRVPAEGASHRTGTARAELAHRAGLFFRLGFSEAEATARLVARVAWEFDPGKGAHRRPDDLSDQAIAKLVAETYARRPG